MKHVSIILVAIFFTSCNTATDTKPTTPAKEILLQQLKNTHTKQEWFATMNNALAGLTADQAMWKDSSANHSIGQLAFHLAYWNERQLAKFKGLKEADFSGNNEETFTAFDKNTWDKTVSKVDSIATEWESAIETAGEEKLKEWYPTLANINTHNAYHTGQIIYIRKMKNWWDPEKGVK